MTCRTRKNLIRDNAGMSLIELVVGLLILTIIMAPTMGLFVAALKSTSQANREMHAQNLANNVMEEVRFYGVNGLKNSAPKEYAATSDGYLYEDVVTNPDGTENRLGYVAEGDEKYYVEVKVEAATDNELNTHLFGDISDIASPNSLIVNPNEGNTVKSHDDIAYETIAGSWTGGGTAAPQKEYIERDLTIKISEKTDATGKKKYSVSYSYKYELDSDVWNYAKYAIPTVEFNSIESSSLVVDDHLDRVYFLYIPWQSEKEADGTMKLSNREKIYVDATGLSKDVDLYIVVQRDDTYTGIRFTNQPTTINGLSYRASIYTEDPYYPKHYSKVVDKTEAVVVHSYDVTVDVYRYFSKTSEESDAAWMDRIHNNRITSVKTSVSK